MSYSAPVIEGLRARAVTVPLARPLRTASGEIPSAPLVLIDVIATDGLEGHAYIFGYSPVTLRALVTLLEDLAPLIRGKPIVPFALAQDFEQTFRLLGRQGLLGMALSGLDMASWDGLGRAENKPVAALLGGQPTPLPAYDSYGAVDPVEDRGEIEKSLAKGFTGIKIKIGLGDLQDDLQAVRGVREIIGEEVRLMVDYNQSLTAAEAIRRIAHLAEYDLEWVEEPVPAEDLAGHAAVRAAGIVPVQTGENWWFPQGMAQAIGAGACDLAMPDLMKIGGVSGWLRAAGQAEAASLPVSSHAFVEASAHVLAVTPTCHWLEYLDIARAILKDPLDVVDGRVTAQSYGLGIEWDEAAVERYAL